MKTRIEMQTEIENVRKRVAALEESRAARVAELAAQIEAQAAIDARTLERLDELALDLDVEAGDVADLGTSPNDLVRCHAGGDLLRALAAAREARELVRSGLAYRTAHAGEAPDATLLSIDGAIECARGELAEAEGELKEAIAAAREFLAA